MIRIDPAKLNGSQTKFFLRGDKVEDASPSARTVTNTGSVSVVTDSTFPYGKALNFNGSAQYLSCADHADFKPASGKIWSLDFWMKYNAVTANQNFIAKGYTSSGEFLVQPDASSPPKMRFFIGGAGVTHTVGDAVGELHHYAFINNGTNVKAYRDGAYIMQLSSASITSTATLYIGYSPTNGANLNAKISGLRWTTGIIRWTKNFIPPSKGY